MNCCCCCGERPATLFGRYCSTCYWRMPLETLNDLYWGPRYKAARLAEMEMDRERKLSEARPLPVGGVRP